MGFTSVPHKLWGTLQQVSRDRDMGDTGIFRAALRFLLDQRDRGVKFHYLSPPKRQGAEDKIAVRKILWMSWKPSWSARQDADRQRADHADLEQVRDELDRARQDAGLWREEADRERVRIANLQADAEHIEQEMARLQAELEQARRPWWRRLVGR